MPGFGVLECGKNDSKMLSRHILAKIMEDWVPFWILCVFSQGDPKVIPPCHVMAVYDCPGWGPHRPLGYLQPESVSPQRTLAFSLEGHFYKSLKGLSTGETRFPGAGRAGCHGDGHTSASALCRKTTDGWLHWYCRARGRVS